MSKYWTEKVDRQDSMTADIFNRAFSAIEDDISGLQENQNKIPDKSITSNKIADKAVSIPKLSSEVITETENLFDYNSVVAGATSLTATISGLSHEGQYSFNMPASVSSGGETLLPLEPIEGHYIINGDEIVDNTVKITFERTANYSDFMFVKGTSLPIQFVPYGYAHLINKGLLAGIENKIEYGTYKVTEPVNYRNTIFYLQPNRIYKMDSGEGVEFVLPTLPNDEYAQILVQATVSVENSVYFGTQYFFNGETPYLEVGKYNLIWEWDGTNWYAGAIHKGQGESV